MIPDYKTVRFALNVTTNYYEKQPTLVPFTKLPNELKVEETHNLKIRQNGANQVIRGRIKDKKYLFFTGLIPSAVHENWYFGNHYEFKKEVRTLSLILFGFSSDFKEMKAYYFNGINVYPSKREEYLTELIRDIRGVTRN